MGINTSSSVKRLHWLSSVAKNEMLRALNSTAVFESLCRCGQTTVIGRRSVSKNSSKNSEKVLVVFGYI